MAIGRDVYIAKIKDWDQNQIEVEKASSHLIKDQKLIKDHQILNDESSILKKSLHSLCQKMFDFLDLLEKDIASSYRSQLHQKMKEGQGLLRDLRTICHEVFKLKLKSLPTYRQIFKLADDTLQAFHSLPSPRDREIYEGQLIIHHALNFWNAQEKRFKREKNWADFNKPRHPKEERINAHFEESFEQDNLKTQTVLSRR